MTEQQPNRNSLFEYSQNFSYHLSQTDICCAYKQNQQRRHTYQESVWTVQGQRQQTARVPCVLQYHLQGVPRSGPPEEVAGRV